MQVVNRYMKRHSESFNTREMQITTSVRYHFTPTRMAGIKKIITDVGEDWGR